MTVRIVLIEDNEELCALISDYLQSDPEFEVVGCAHDGISGLELIKAKQPDIAVIDIVLPGKDGISILESLKILHMPITTFILTAVSSPVVTKQALELGASYIMLKPFDLKILSIRMKQFISEKMETIHLAHSIPTYSKKMGQDMTIATGEIDMQKSMAALLFQIGIFPHLKGSKYLKYGLHMVWKDATLLEGVTKRLYPEIAKAHKTNPAIVERAIRHSIETAWKKGDPSVYYALSESTPRYNARRPTNSQFIRTLVEYFASPAYLHLA